MNNTLRRGFAIIRFFWVLLALILTNTLQAQWSHVKSFGGGAFMDSFGDEVTMGEDVIIVGVSLRDMVINAAAANDVGIATFYTKDGIAIQTVTASDKADEDRFGYSVAVSEDYAIIGAPQEDHDTAGANFKFNAGSAYIFERNSLGQWQEVQKLVASDRDVNDRFGTSVSIRGNYAWVGAPGHDYDTASSSFKNDAGAVYVFERNNLGDWQQVQKLVSSDRDVGDSFGNELAQSIDYLLVGAINEDHNVSGAQYEPNAGSVYIFKRDSINRWYQTQKLVASDRDEEDQFSSDIAIHGEWMIVGAMEEDHDTTGSNTEIDAGAAYIFQLDSTGQWQERQKLVASNRDADDNFGTAVAISDSGAIVGAPNTEHYTSATWYNGRAYFFERTTSGLWVEYYQTFRGSNNARFGSSIAMLEDTAVIGALGGSNQAGRAFIFRECRPRHHFHSSVTTCSTSYTWPVNNLSYYSSGYYQEKHTNSSGCDSVYSLSLILGSSGPFLETVIACDSFWWSVDSTTYTQSGSYTKTMTNRYGCDSTHIIDLIIGHTFIDTQTVTACDSYLWPVDSVVYTNSGIYTDSLTTIHGCDSILHLDLTVNYRNYSVHSVTSCGSYTWPANNQTYTQSGVYRDTSVNALGCDSVKVLFLNIKPVHIDSSVVSVCNSYTWPVNQVTYTSSGSYTETLTNTAGCDSVLMLNLTVTQGPTRQIAVNTCNSYTWPVTNQTYTQTGIYQHLKPNGMGCDSILVLDLTLRFDSTYTQHALACGSYTWPVNNQTYTTSGIYQENLTNANGCDSVMILDLTIIPNSSGAVSATACDSYTWPLNNQTYNTTGTYTDTLNNTRGCDSVVTLSLTILESTASTETITACTQYTWLQNNRTYFQSGTYTHTLTNAAGCDSILTLDLTLIKVNTQVTSTGQTLSADLGGATYQWLNCIQQYQPVPGATQQQFAPSSNGNYAVEIKENGCTDTSICYAIINLNRSDDWFTQSIKVYPNPTNGHITLELGQPYERVQLTIRDAQGKQVAQQSFANLQQLTTELKGAKGIYFLELLTSDGKTALFEIVKE